MCPKLTIILPTQPPEHRITAVCPPLWLSCFFQIQILGGGRGGEVLLCKREHQGSHYQHPRKIGVWGCVSTALLLEAGRDSWSSLVKQPSRISDVETVSGGVLWPAISSQSHWTGHVKML